MFPSQIVVKYDLSKYIVLFPVILGPHHQAWFIRCIMCVC